MLELQLSSLELHYHYYPRFSPSLLYYIYVDTYSAHRILYLQWMIIIADDIRHFWIQLTHGFSTLLHNFKMIEVSSSQRAVVCFHLRKRLSSHCGRCHCSLWQITRSRSSLCDRHGWTWWKDCTNSSFFDCKVKTVPTSLWLPYFFEPAAAHTFSDCTCLVYPCAKFALFVQGWPRQDSSRACWRNCIGISGL